MNADLLRQRRNLLIVSLGLTAIYLAGAKFKKDISILGAGIEIESPERIISGAWVLWFYFLIRYFQYLAQEGDLGIRTAIGNHILNRHYSYRDFDRRIKLVWHGWIRWRVYEDSGENPDHDFDPEEDSTLWLPIGPNGLVKKIIWTISGVYWVSASTPRFTDYILPIVVAAIPAGMYFDKILN